MDHPSGPMELKSGEKLGPYEILSRIGVGGMGEVWKARDPRLNRDVAIKVSAYEFTDRFEREARTIAALNHPNVCTLHDIGPNYLVMELVEGPTLAERIRQGPIPLEEALAIAKQIADALEAAHEKAIVHRDLKPANIKIRPDGSVKVLDFGLAKAGVEVELSDDSPTMTQRTQAGMIRGTAGYMSPEQARGQAVDKRTDIWAFGVVLHEMLSGQRLFAGATLPDSLVAVLTKEPDLTLAPAKTRRLLLRCLEKDPKKRLRDIGDAMPLVSDEAMAETARRSKWPWAFAAPFAVAALVLAAVHFREKPPAPPAVARFQIRLPEKVSFTSSGAFTLSPDGRHLAFSAIGEDKIPRVWIQDLDSLEARVLRDTYTGVSPPPFFWSPDSRFVVYSENSQKLKKADVQTGALQDICDKPGPPIGGSWSSTGTIIFGSTSTGLWKVSAAGGKPVPLTALDASRHERQHELPSFLPDGKHFLYLRASSVPEESGIFAGSVDDPPERQNRKRILATGLGAYYSPGQEGTGRLLFLNGDTLMAQPFDPATLELSGEPAPVARGVGSIYQTGYFSATAETLAYRTSASIRDSQLTWFDRQGKPLGTAGEPGSISNVRISPDGTRVAYRKDSFNLAAQDIWLLDLNKGSSSRFTFGPGTSELPLWSPDSSELVFSSDRDGVLNLYRKPANGAREETPLLRSNLNKRAESWSRDGKFLLYCTSPSVVFSDNDLWVLPMQGDHTPSPFLKTRFDECGKLSPDGHWVAYSSNEGGRYDVYVREFVPSKDSATPGGKWLVSKDGGRAPLWREDGKELVYEDNKGVLMSVSLDTTSATTRTFQAGTPQALFQIPSGANSISQTSDMKRFLITVPVERKTPQAFTVVVNWMSALKP